MLAARQDRLDNGLQVITLDVPHLHLALLAIYVRAGSRHETPASNGVSHFLEHMFFRGGARYPDTRVMNGLVEDVGGNLNGCTLRDHGFYYTPIHPAHLDVGLSVLGDMLTAPRLEGIDVEREIILEEMLDEVDAEGRDIDLDNLAKMRVFEGHPLAMKIAGTPETVRALTLDQLRAHFGEHYVAENMLVVAAGQVRHDEVLVRSAEAFGRLPRGKRSSERAPVIRVGPDFSFVAHEESQIELRLTFPCAPEKHPDYPALMLLRRILDDGLSSRLPLNVVERRGLAYSVNAGIDTYSDVSLFEVEAACTPSKVVSVLEELALQLRTLCVEPLPQDELARLKRRHRIHLDFTLDQPGDLVGWYGSALFHAPLTFEERCSELDAVTPEQLLEVARRTFSRKNLLVCAVGPAKGKAEQKLAAAVAALDLP